jgi:hypothetical protein
MLLEHGFRKAPTLQIRFNTKIRRKGLQRSAGNGQRDAQSVRVGFPKGTNMSSTDAVSAISFSVIQWFKPPTNPSPPPAGEAGRGRAALDVERFDLTIHQGANR